MKNVSYSSYKHEWDKNRCALTSNKEPGFRNLDFFVEIVRHLNITYKQLSEMTGLSQQLISYWLHTDDVKYFRIVELFQKINIQLSCSFVSDRPCVFRKDSYGIKFGTLPSFASNQVGKGNILTELIAGNARLKFLAELIVDSGLTLPEFTRRMGLPYYTVYNWLQKDDLKVSRIYEIAQKTNTLVSWRVEMTPFHGSEKTNE